jgi:long-chain fatty acid transport protein
MFAAIVFFILGAGDVYANIDNLSNMSAEWIRTGNRNAATDAADIVVYNPGGVSQLPDGIQVNIGNQTLFRNPQHSYDLGMGAESHEQDGTDWFLPNVYITYNKDNWAIFGGYYIPGGGAVVDYPDGSITTDMIGAGMVMDGMFDGYDNESMKAESVYNTLTLGGAYTLNDKVSVALGMRYILVKNNIKAGITGLTDLGGGVFFETDLAVDVDDEADGLGFIAGVNVNLTPKINMGLQYQSKVNLDLETSVNQDDLGFFADGEKHRRDFPGMLGLGLGIDLSDKLYTEINTSYWFQKDCNWGKDALDRDIADLAGDAMSVGATVSYRFLPGLLASAGMTYTNFLWEDMDAYYEANLGSYEVLYTDNWHIGCGVAYTLVDNVVMNVSVARTVWDDEDLSNSQLPGVTIETQNDTTIVAIGFNVGF